MIIVNTIKKLTVTGIFSIGLISTLVAQTQEKPMNVLFLISDDMRAELGVYGSATAHTPHIDRLATKGVRFEHAYCQYPLSGPSRASLLTGRRPTTSGLYSNREWFGATYPEWLSLTGYFRRHGYVTQRSGKVFHGGIDDTDSWTEGGEIRKWNNPVNTAPPSAISEAEICEHYVRITQQELAHASTSDRWEAVVGAAADSLGDTKVANRAIEYIRRSKQSGKPFFIACGFSKPHTPFVAPKQFFDLYDADSIPLSPDFASLPMVPVGFPQGCIRPKNADLFINRGASPEESRAMIRAYLACISYVDWNVGRVLAELEAQGLSKNTIIVFWSDHGYQLGEKGKWSKAGSLWEQGARVPLVILDPRAKGNGRTSHRIVELIDVYPTLVDLCGLPLPDGLDGASLKPLLNYPDTTWNRPAYTVWNEHGKGITGVAVRTERWRYARFFGYGAGAYLTDPVVDPHELRNLVNEPKYRNVVAELHRLATDYVAGKTELPIGSISAQHNERTLIPPLEEANETERLQKKTLQSMHKVNNYFMGKYADFTQPSHVGKTRPSNIWTRGVYYEGLMALYQIEPKPEFYNYALGWAEFHRWGLRNGNTTRNADDQCCGQTYIDLYNISPHSEKIRNIQACIDMLVTTQQTNDWSWIDAIQMAMPVFAKLGKLTGDTRYYEKMYQMYSFTRNKHGVNGLFNPQEGLWWRDVDFVPPYKEPNGKNCYWSRGNGWVYAALVRVLEILPADEPHRMEYTADFLAMSEALKGCRREDGFWNVSLHDPTNYGGKETTGTSLFVYGMAWGINNGLLDREIYLPIVLQAWNAMVKDAVHPNGFLGWVQSTGKEPKDGQPVTYDKVPDFEDYGVGCFLLGGSEVYKLLMNNKPQVLFIGDSTVKNGAGKGSNGQWGWGDQIAQFFDTNRISVVNRARGGRSSRTYISEGLWDETLSSIKSGDFVLIQFGHNDGSPVNDTLRARGSIKGIGEEMEEIENLITKKHEIVHTFGWYLRKYVADTKAKGATPIIVSPIPRNNFKDGKTIRNNTNYGGWAKQVAESENVPFIDLNERVAAEYDKIIAEFGQAIIDSCYFYGDHTHTSLTGAKMNACQVIAGIRALPNSSLKDYLLDKKYEAISDEKSFYFSIPLSEGNYDVTLLIGNPDKASETTVRGESRRLFLEKIKTKKGQYTEHSFTINIRNKHISPSKEVRIKPREIKKLNWDDTLTLEFTGLNPSVQSIRIRPAEQALTIFLCGNSTVVDQDNEPWCGWGQMITRFFGRGISFANYAESGESANTFIAAGRLEKILTQAKPGDYIFVEFGHNDQKQKGEGIGPWSSFVESLKIFITEARKRGMHSVLLTPVQRRRFDEKGKIINTHGEYPDAIRKLARDEKVPLIDLHQMSQILYEALGEKNSLKTFVHYPAGTFPNQEKALEDNTHFNSYGGYEIARCVIEGVRQNGLDNILQYLYTDIYPFNPEKPDNVKKFSLPLSPFIEFEKPDGN